MTHWPDKRVKNVISRARIRTYNYTYARACNKFQPAKSRLVRLGGRLSSRVHRAQDMAASTSGKRGRGRPPRPTAEDGPKIRILLGRGAKAQAMRQEVNSIRRECGLETIGDTVEFLCSKWRRCADCYVLRPVVVR